MAKLTKINKNNLDISSHIELLVDIRKIITKSNIRCLISEIREIESGNYQIDDKGKYWSEWYGKYCSIEFMKGLLGGVKDCDDSINTLIEFSDKIKNIKKEG